MRIVAPDAAGLAAAVEALRAGEVVAYPVETVYGLAVDPFSGPAIQRLFEVKGRDAGNPILLIVAGETQLSQVAREISGRAAACIEAFWPGPLSLLLPKAGALPESITAGKPAVCVRCPAAAAARELCSLFGGALTSTSANRSGAAPATSLQQLALPGVALGIDAGALPSGPPSTIFDPARGRVLRAGPIPEAALSRVLR